MKPFVLPGVAIERNYDAIDPLDSRYYDTEIARYLSERTRVRVQAYVEAALALTLAEYKICTVKAAKEIEVVAAKIDISDVYNEEQTTKHDMKALVNCIKAGVSDEAKPFVHFGATSYDIIATAQSYQMRLTIRELLVPRLTELLRTLLLLSKRYASTTQVGRTHGQHAVPITFGFSMAGYVSRLGESIGALEELSQALYGKFSGAVGAYNALSVFIDKPVEFETSILKKLGLFPAPHSTQIVPAEQTIRVLDELAVTAGIMANLSHDMRHLQRTEIGEVRERFEPGQTGSSTMAHKRNPWNFENVISMSKQVTAQMVNANLNISSEHQRDLTDSASSRFYAVSLACVASMSERLNRVLSKLEVDEEAMHKNLLLTGGAIAAEPLYLLLEKYGHTSAHEAAKSIAHRALQKNLPLHEVLASDTSVVAYVSRFTPKELLLLAHPETHYTGLAEWRANKIYAEWSLRLRKKSKL